MMHQAVRKFVLTVHVTVSVGWIGAVAAYIVLDLAAATGQDPAPLRAAYLAMDWVASAVIVPLAITTLLTGLVMSLGTKWGLFRHYWTVLSLLLTSLAVVVLLAETRAISTYAAVAADPTSTTDDLRALGTTLIHSVGGLVVLLANMWLNVYKPRGLTPYGWRKQQAERSQPARRAPAARDPEAAGGA